MNPIEEMLIKSGALLEGHFILSSGNHSPNYLQCAVMLQHPEMAEKSGALLAEALREFQPEVVISPALGGVVIGQEVGRALGLRAIFGERKGGEMMLRRGFSLKRGERVVVVEDVVTTGKSVQEVIALVQAAGADPVAVGSLVFRHTKNPFAIPLRHLWQAVFPLYPPDTCPLCAEGTQAVKPGSRGA